MVLLRAPLASASALRTAARSFSTASTGTIPVASLNDARAAASVTVAIKAGPRYAPPGAAAALKNWLFQANEARSALATIREAELRGGVLSTSISKDAVFLHAGFLAEDRDFFLALLGDALSSPKLYPWEFNEHVLPALAAEAEAAEHSPQLKALEALTATAYHGKGPGASYFISPGSPLSVETATNYVRQSLTADNISVSAAGLDVGEVAELVGQNFNLKSGSKNTPEAAKYYGGEARVPFASHGEEEFILAYDAGKLAGKPELTVLAHLLGGQTHVKWSKGQSLLSKVATEVEGAKAAPVDLSFEGAGLFGVQVSTHNPETSARAVQLAFNALKDLAQTAPQEKVQAAIAQAKFNLASHFEGHGVSEFGAQAQVAGKDLKALESHLSALEVSPSAVSSAAATLLSSKPTSAAVGNVYKLPYAADLQ